MIRSHDNLRQKRPQAVGRSAHWRPAFTLAEMIVAIGAVAILSIGIGQIFQSVGGLVGSGSALAETDQAARAIEKQLRDDFDALGRLRQEDTFLAIRNRRTRNIYLSRDDRDADRRAGIGPTDPNSLAITARLDDIICLAFGGGEEGQYPSAQLAQPSSGTTPPRADTVRIYYGHGLRPQPDIRFDPDQPPSDSNVRRRQWLPDGDFGQGRGSRNRFGGKDKVSGRNEFAGSWILLRQQLLLMGGRFAGSNDRTNAGFDPALTYTPYPRTQEVFRRAANWPNIDSDRPQNWPGNATPAPYGLIPKPRYLPFGRTDICAMSPETLKRWIEGVNPNPLPPATPVYIDATPFDTGFLDLPFDGSQPPEFISRDGALWQRGVNDADNLRNYQSAIAGMFVRLQAESDPPQVDRRDSLTLGDTSAGATLKGDDPSAALMDLHATLATNCSRFEIAWSDGTTWPDDVPLRLDVDGDGINDIVYEKGDIVWFDINFPRYEQTPGGGQKTFATEVKTLQFIPPSIAANPEITIEEKRAARRLVKNIQTPGAYVVGTTGNTESMITGAVADRDPDSDEYLAVWGYRQLAPGGSGEYLPSPGGWIKPKLIRFRITLHDSQFRLEGGRTYEFILSVDLKQ